MVVVLAERNYLEIVLLLHLPASLRLSLSAITTTDAAHIPTGRIHSNN
ncbi:MAG: hypothetical protein JO297_03520 [Nitrososphaeraceae archaeon]|nr:hypothetical protein [Nitrososphaeraceae archaeon]